MNDSPAGWIDGKIGDLFEFTYGKSLPEKIRIGKDIPVYGSNGVVGYHNKPLTAGETIIIGRKGSVGEVNFSPTPCFPIDTTYYIGQFHGLPAKFWFYLMKFSNLGNLNKATAIPGLNRNDAYDVDIAIPPLNEQKRIADKLDTLLARVDSCERHLERVLQILKRFRQSVLAAATSGRLTEEWREEREVSGEWEATTVGEIAEVFLGRQRSPENHYGEHMRKYVRAANVTWNGWDFSDVKEMNFNPRDFEKYSLRVGDILLNEGSGSADEVGKPAVWNGEIEDCCFQNTLICVRPHTASSKYLYYLFLYTAMAKIFVKDTRGVNIFHIGKERLAKFEISLPSLEEQAEIVRRVETLFAFAARLETRYATGRGLVEQLTPSLLAKAFRGELVEQDPKDESAEGLVERIRETRDAQKASSGGKSKKSKRS